MILLIDFIIINNNNNKKKIKKKFIEIVQFIPIRNFIEWLEDKLKEKFEKSLSGLKTKFYEFYSVLKTILISLLHIA